MKKNNIAAQPEVLMVYQDKSIVEMSIKQIAELKLKFASYKMESTDLKKIQAKKPKVLLISSNDVKHSIQYYIDYLEEYEQNIPPHRAVLLINNRETLCAYLACENGLFDDYAIINPLNEPYRLKLALLQQLKLIESHKSNGLEELNAKGDDELASCIEHGVTLKKAFVNEVDQCKKNLLGRANDSLDDESVLTIFKQITDLSLDELNQNVTADIDAVIGQLVKLKEKNEALAEADKKKNESKTKQSIEANTTLLLHDKETLESDKPKNAYKILIAESCSSFSVALDEIFTDASFECAIVEDGKLGLSIIEKFKPDIILIAYDLAPINGIELTKLIRKKGINTPIVGYAHKRDSKMINNWITLGLSGSLIKPLKKSVLIQMVNQSVNNPVEIMQYNDTSAGDKIQWIPAYSIGNKEIDDQHKILFDMINEFFCQEGMQATISIFENLSSYIDLHFESEENLLRQINYPKTSEHIAKHDELRVKFKLLLDKLEDYSVEVHHKIALFLYNWLASHILKSDMDYKSYAISLEEPSFMGNKESEDN